MAGTAGQRGAALAPTTATQAKIGALREKFAGFQSQWEVETKHRINRDGTKLDVVKDSMVKLEQTLNSEVKRRVEANKALQAMFESQIFPFKIAWRRYLLIGLTNFSSTLTLLATGCLL